MEDKLKNFKKYIVANFMLYTITTLCVFSSLKASSKRQNVTECYKSALFQLFSLFF